MKEYWQEELETLDRKALEELQLTRLRETVKRAVNSPFYQKVFAEHNISVDTIQTLEDLKKIPFTTKDDCATIILLVWRAFR